MSHKHFQWPPIIWPGTICDEVGILVFHVWLFLSVSLVRSCDPLLSSPSLFLHLSQQKHESPAVAGLCKIQSRRVSYLLRGNNPTILNIGHGKCACTSLCTPTHVFLWIVEFAKDMNQTAYIIAIASSSRIAQTLCRFASFHHGISDMVH